MAASDLPGTLCLVLAAAYLLQMMLRFCAFPPPLLPEAAGADLRSLTDDDLFYVSASDVAGSGLYIARDVQQGALLRSVFGSHESGYPGFIDRSLSEALHFPNHESEEANAHVAWLESEGRWVFVANRDIMSHEEIFVDYWLLPFYFTPPLPHYRSIGDTVKVGARERRKVRDAAAQLRQAWVLSRERFVVRVIFVVAFVHWAKLSVAFVDWLLPDQKID